MENLNEDGEETRGEESESRKGNERNRNLEEKPDQDGPQWKSSATMSTVIMEDNHARKII